MSLVQKAALTCAAIPEEGPDELNSDRLEGFKAGTDWFKEQVFDMIDKRAMNAGLPAAAAYELIKRDIEGLYKTLTPTRKFYRISHEDTHQGVWYDIQGNFTGFIHDRFKFCKNNELAMDFDKKLVGYLSAADSMEVLYHWFPKEDIIELQKHGWYLHAYESEDYWFYERFQHFVINQSTMRLIEKIVLQ